MFEWLPSPGFCLNLLVCHASLFAFLRWSQLSHGLMRPQLLHFRQAYRHLMPFKRAQDRLRFVSSLFSSSQADLSPPSLSRQLLLFASLASAVGLCCQTTWHLVMCECVFSPFESAQYDAPSNLSFPAFSSLKYRCSKQLFLRFACHGS